MTSRWSDLIDLFIYLFIESYCMQPKEVMAGKEKYKNAKAETTGIGPLFQGPAGVC